MSFKNVYTFTKIALFQILPPPLQKVYTSPFLMPKIAVEMKKVRLNG